MDINLDPRTKHIVRMKHNDEEGLQIIDSSDVLTQATMLVGETLDRQCMRCCRLQSLIAFALFDNDKIYCYISTYAAPLAFLSIKIQTSKLFSQQLCTDKQRKLVIIHDKYL